MLRDGVLDELLQRARDDVAVAHAQFLAHVDVYKRQVLTWKKDRGEMWKVRRPMRSRMVGLPQSRFVSRPMMRCV